MELLTYEYEGEDVEYTYYLDKNGEMVLHGEYKDFYHDGTLWEHSLLYNGRLHGEFKYWDIHGTLIEHCFYIHGEVHPYVEMTDQEKLLFQIQHPGFRFIED